MGNLKNYINYLNSLHNASANNENAIAESQILNEYYNKIKIEREIGETIREKLKNENLMIVLTGHAGDGKTSLLDQIIKKSGKNYQMEKIGYFDIEGKDILYVKDLSEFNKEDQYVTFEKLYKNIEKGSSVLISNVGPLIENFKIFFKEHGLEEDESEDLILDVIDDSNGKYIIINEKKIDIIVINIARISNISFIGEFVEKILNPELWKEEKYSNTNIYKNIEICFNQKEKIKKIIERFYIWQHEHNERSTIRQIIAHIAYSLTGNLSLEESIALEKEYLLVNNNFAHYFLGYKNNNLDIEGQQINSIRKIGDLKLDEKKINNEHFYFIEENYDNLFKEFCDYYKEIVWSDLDENKLKNIRKSIRRNAMFWSDSLEDIDQIYGKNFSSYLKIKKEGKIDENLQERVFKGISRLLTGLPLEERRKREIYLTLKREGSFVQNIQLILGKIEKRDIRLTFEKNKENSIDKDKKELYLSLGKGKIKEKITFPLLSHLLDLEKGCVKTEIDPHLSNGIENLKSKLIKNNMSNYNDENILDVLVVTNRGSSVYEFNILDDEIIVN